VSAVRIRPVFFAAVPAESYPETELLLRIAVKAQRHFLFSLAEDQLGYDPPSYEIPRSKSCSPFDEHVFTPSANLGATVTRTLLDEAQTMHFTVEASAVSRLWHPPKPGTTMRVLTPPNPQSRRPR
jgi:hypothetical protein